MKTIKDEVYESLTNFEKHLVKLLTKRRTRKELMFILGVNDSNLRHYIMGLKDKGVPIHSTNKVAGYKLATTKEEIDEVTDYEFKLAMKYLTRISKRKNLNFDQIILEMSE